MAPRRLPTTVYALGLVSFCTDLGSEMIVPLLPALFTSLGASRLQLGLLQGLSDLVVAALRIASGWLSDRRERRKPWILFGYGLSTAMRPAFALVTAPWHALLVRSLDRVGKGVRSAPRDALVADLVDRAGRGRAFGMQRALDHAGAMAGAVAASACVFAGLGLRSVFALSLLPGLAAVLLIVFAVREPDRGAAAKTPGPAARPACAAPTPRRLLPFLVVVAVAAIGGTVDLFAIARAGELGVPVALHPLLWAALHVARATLAAPLGAWSDRIGRRTVIAVGLALHAPVLLGFALVDAPGWLWPLFVALGLHAAFTEGAERGFVADLVDDGRRHGRAFGVYYAVAGLAAFAGTALLGALWDAAGAGAAFGTAAGATLVALILLLILVRAPR